MPNRSHCKGQAKQPTHTKQRRSKSSVEILSKNKNQKTPNTIKYIPYLFNSQVVAIGFFLAVFAGKMGVF
jgi:hypothetical protein